MGEGCARCGVVDDRRLFARLSAERALCSACWRREGRPAPEPSPETPEVVAAIQGRMVQRGGDQRHAVRAGRT